VNGLRQSREYASSERYAIDETELRERKRDQDDAVRKSLAIVERECRSAYEEWTAREPVGETSSREEVSENAWDAWLTRRLEAEGTLIWDTVAAAVVQLIDEERQSIRNEIETKINRLRVESARERASDIREQKVLLSDIKGIISKIARREFDADELPTRTH
jgi:hypothetical protein